MGTNKVLLVLLYYVLYTTLLPLPWNDDGVNHPKYPSGVHIGIYVLHHTKPHVWLHCACTSKYFHQLYHVVYSIPFAHFHMFVNTKELVARLQSNTEVNHPFSIAHNLSFFLLHLTFGQEFQ